MSGTFDKLVQSVERLWGASDSGRLEAELDRLLREGRFHEAERAARRLLGHQRSVCGERHPAYAAALARTGLLLQRRGDLSGAERPIREALELRREVLGEHHPHVAASLAQLAELFRLRDDLESAEPLLRQAVPPLRRSAGGNGPALADALTSLGLLRQRLGDLDEAVDLLREALEARRAAQGERDPLHAAGLVHLGIAHQARGELDQAETLIRQALSIQREVLGDDHPEVGAGFSLLAQIVALRGSPAAAEPLFRQAIEVRAAALGEWHSAVLADRLALEALRPRPGPSSRPAPKAAPGLPPPPTRPLVAELDALADAFRQLGPNLAESARRVTEDGLPPDPRALEEAAACLAAYEALRAELARRVEALGPEAGARRGPGDGPVGLEALREQAVRVSRLESDRRLALDRLDQVLALRPRDAALAGHWQPVRDMAVALRDHLGATDARRLAEGDHPLARLLELTEATDTTSDDEWTDLYQTVADTLGKPLAVAAARRRLAPGRRRAPSA